VRSAVNLAVTVASLFLGAGLAVLLSAVLYNPAFLILYNTGAISALESLLGAFYVIVLIVIGMIATLVCFIPCFIIAYALISLVVRIILSLKGGRGPSGEDEFFSENDDLILRRDKRIGAMIGAASALLVSIAMLSPVTGLLKATSNTVGLISDVTGMKVEDMAPIVVELDGYSDDFMVTVIDACGGRMWFNMSTTTYCYGNFTNVNKEINIIRELGTEELSELLKSIGELDSESVSDFERFVGKIEKSPVMRLILSVAVNDLSKAWLADRDYKGAARPQLGNDLVDGFLDDILSILETSDVNTVNADVMTTLKIASIIREYEDVFSADNYAEMADMLSDGELVDRLKAEIKKNRRMLGLEQSIDDIMMRAFAEEISDFGKFTVEQRDELYRQLADILSSSAGLVGGNRVNMVAGDIADALDDYGVYAPADMTSGIAEMLISGLSADGSMVSVEDVSSYFEGYLASGLPVGGITIPGVPPLE
jgi:hypothetical protein